MKIKLAQAVALMVAVGFPKAGDWDLDKLQSRVKQVPQKVDRSTVPDEYLNLYDDIAKAGEDVTVESGEAAPAKKKKDRSDKGTSVPADPEKEPKAKSKTKNKVKAKKPSADKVVKAAKAVASSTKVERDAFGCAKGTISHKVNGVLSNDWQDESEIAKAAGVDLDQARGRLYYAAEKEIIEYRKRIEYRIKPAAPAKSKK